MLSMWYKERIKENKFYKKLASDKVPKHRQEMLGLLSSTTLTNYRFYSYYIYPIFLLSLLNVG